MSSVQRPMPPDRLLLLYSDRSDAVTALLLEQPQRFARDVVAVSLESLVERTTVGAGWVVDGRVVDPARTAVVNRLVPPSSNAGAPSSSPSSYFAQRQLWRWLHRALRQFAYVSSVPTATSMIGCHGSLLDQWTELPTLVGGLRVPVHRGPWSDDPLAGDVQEVDPWRLYSLGTPRGPVANRGALSFVKPHGHLLHVAQVGGLVLFAQVPPGMTTAHQSAIVSFANAMAGRSSARILEHAFFVGDGPPVFYSTCPFPVITGLLPQFAELLAQGLRDDISRRAVHDPA